MSVLEVRNNFIKKRVTVKSRDLMSALFNGHTSKEYYNSIGTHLLFTRRKYTSSEASLNSFPILLNSAFTDRKNDRFALSNEHLNLQHFTITMPRYMYVILSTHSIGVPSPLKVSAHFASCRWPIRIQHDFLALIRISSKFSSFSHMLTIFCSSLTDGDISNMSLYALQQQLLRPCTDLKQYALVHVLNI